MNRKLRTESIFYPLTSSPRTSLVFDVGAHKGNKTRQYLALGVKKVVCFEPQPDMYQAILKNKNCNVDVYNVALGSESSVMKMHTSTMTTISTLNSDWKTGRFKEYEWLEPIEVKVEPISKFIEQYGRPDYVKIDVEGFELEVLKGLGDVLPTVISFEYTEEFSKTYKDCLELLEKKGYSKFNVSLEETGFFSIPWGTKEELLDYLDSIHCNKFSWGDIYAMLSE